MSLKKKENVACSHADQNEGIVMSFSSVLSVSPLTNCVTVNTRA
jgi:hypothetical protein